MKKIVLVALILLFTVFAVVYNQYNEEIKVANQRVLEGSKVIVTEKGKIEYAVEGEGTPVLLIHGAGGGYDQGLLIGKQVLGDGYKFISVSRFGYLRSPFVNDSTVENQAALYASLLDYLGIDKVIVFAVSAGGPSGLQFAHDYPDRSRALILMSAVSMYMGDEIPLSTKVVNTIQKTDFSYWLVLKVFRTQFLELIGISKETYTALGPVEKKFADDMLAYMHPMSQRFPGNIHEAKIVPLSGEAMSKLTVPTIILHAKDDYLVPFQHGEFYHSNIEHSELVAFDSGGHGMISKLHDMVGQVDDFLARNP